MNENIIDRDKRMGIPDDITTDKDLPDSQVKVKLATCPKCGGFVQASVEHLMDKKMKREFGNLVASGYDASTVKLLDFRDNKYPMHDKTKCDYK